MDASAEPGSVVVGDYSGDGILDLAVANIQEDDISILLGNGDGSFQDPMSTGVDAHPRGLVTADLRGTGQLDLAVVSHPSMTQQAHVGLLFGEGNGIFDPGHNQPVGTGGDSIAVGDFNHDGKLDLAVTNFADNTVSILLGNGDGTFRPRQDFPAGNGPVGIAVDYFFGDGNLSLAVADRLSDSVSILRGNGDGTFQPPQTYPAGPQAFSITSADFNGDGHPDLAVADRGGGVSVLLNNGDGTFAPPVSYDAGDAPWSIAFGDFNGDGVPDLVVGNNGSGNVSVLTGNGDGTFQNAVNYDVGASGIFAVAVGDFDSDGTLDIVTANRDSGNVSILLNMPGNAPSPHRGGQHGKGGVPAGSGLFRYDPGAGSPFAGGNGDFRVGTNPSQGVASGEWRAAREESPNRPESALLSRDAEGVRADHLSGDVDPSGTGLFDWSLSG
jgi:hypothetical protein